MNNPIVPIVVNTELHMESPVKPLVMETHFVAKVPKLATTPSVKNVKRHICVNTVPTTITQFNNGQEGQEIQVLGDGQTTVKNNANISTLSGADTLLTLGRLFKFTMFNGIWIGH